MDKTIRRSLFSVRDENNEHIGLAFIFTEDERFTYFLTCKHVVVGDDGEAQKVCIGRFASVEASEASVFQWDRTGTLDLAVLRVPRHFSLPIPKLALDEDEGEVHPGEEVLVYEMAQEESERGPSKTLPFIRPISAKIQDEDENLFEPSGNYQFFSIKPIRIGLKEAMSGSPVFHKKNGNIIGVLAIRDVPSSGNSVQEGGSSHLERIGSGLANGLIVPINAVPEIWSNHRFFPFTNRKEEMRIPQSQGKKYYWIDGPIGYGKTRLLLRLKNLFLEENWLCAYVQVRSGPNLSKLVQDIAEEFEVGVLMPSQSQKLQTNDLGNALRERWKRVRKSPGIALLLDFDGQLNPRALRLVVRDFVPKFIIAISSMREFKYQAKSLRIVLAGRHINAFHNLYREPPTRSGPDEDLRLLPYRFEFLNASLQLFLPDKDPDVIDQFAADAFFLTGGYPFAISELAQRFNRTGLDSAEFLRQNQEVIWRQVIKKSINKVLSGLPKIPPEIRIFAESNVLRCVDIFCLNDFLSQHRASFKNLDSGKILKDKLFEAKIIDKVGENPLFLDDMIRRIVSLKLRRDNAKWEELCREAIAICNKRLLDEKNPTPNAWFREFLFQSLQKHTNSIGDPLARQQLHSKFFNDYLPEAVNLLRLEGNREDVWDKQSLVKDWELQFTINYFLRKDQYTDSIWKEFLDKVEEYFSD